VSIGESIVCAVAIAGAVVAASLNSLSPELAGIIGVALGYVGKGAVKGP
jgi:hypothetical protein